MKLDCAVLKTSGLRLVDRRIGLGVVVVDDGELDVGVLLRRGQGVVAEQEADGDDDVAVGVDHRLDVLGEVGRGGRLDLAGLDAELVLASVRPLYEVWLNDLSSKPPESETMQALKSPPRRLALALEPGARPTVRRCRAPRHNRPGPASPRQRRRTGAGKSSSLTASSARSVHNNLRPATARPTHRRHRRNLTDSSRWIGIATIRAVDNSAARNRRRSVAASVRWRPPRPASVTPTRMHASSTSKVGWWMSARPADRRAGRRAAPSRPAPAAASRRSPRRPATARCIVDAVRPEHGSAAWVSRSTPRGWFTAGGTPAVTVDLHPDPERLARSGDQLGDQPLRRPPARLVQGPQRALDVPDLRDRVGHRAGVDPAPHQRQAAARVDPPGQHQLGRGGQRARARRPGPRSGAGARCGRRCRSG